MSNYWCCHMSRKDKSMQMSVGMSHMNEWCHTWMRPVAYEYAIPRRWVCRVTQEWATWHHIRMWRVSSCVSQGNLHRWKLQVTCVRVLPRMTMSYHTRTRYAAYAWVASHLNESCHTWLRHTTYMPGAAPNGDSHRSHRPGKSGGKRSSSHRGSRQRCRHALAPHACVLCSSGLPHITTMRRNGLCRLSLQPQQQLVELALKDVTGGQAVVRDQAVGCRVRADSLMAQRAVCGMARCIVCVWYLCVQWHMHMHACIRTNKHTHLQTYIHTHYIYACI